jgi:alkanesulfonate monooxygenase SsuD/methylene tetrahydromethanopterin reductase-like flavin-dependent oxidoreductase (luciferase family)
VEARFLQASDTAGLRAEAARAGAEGVDAVFLSEDALGDPVVLAAGLAPVIPGLLLGARVRLDAGGRNPAMLARDVTSLDLVCGGRSVLCFAPPFTEQLAEAISVCRAMWRAGEVRSDGPRFPLRAAANRSRPRAEGSPLIALDLTAGDQVPPVLIGAPDLVLRPISTDPAACRLERV